MALQTIGRGLRLPFGEITGVEELDTLDIVAHDHYREIIDDVKNNPIFKQRNLDEEDIDNMNVWGRALTPLSAERADAIKNYLIKKGVSASVLATVGMGGKQPVVDPKDKDNNWKNRRVEFILQK